MFAAAFMNRRDRSGAPAEKSLSSLRCVENKATTAIFLALIWHLPLPHICLHNNKLNAIIHGCDGGKKCEREREKEMAISTQRQIGFYPLMLYVRQHMQANFSEVRTALLSQIKLCSARWS